MSVIKSEGCKRRARERGRGGEVMKPLIGHALARLPSIDPVTPSPTSVKIMPHQSVAYIWHCGQVLHFGSKAFPFLSGCFCVLLFYCLCFKHVFVYSLWCAQFCVSSEKQEVYGFNTFLQTILSLGSCVIDFVKLAFWGFLVHVNKIVHALKHTISVIRPSK